MAINRRRCLATLGATSAALMSLTARAETKATRSQSWPRWLGPDGTNRVDAELALEWSETKNVRWKTPIAGRGWSSPVIADELIWITTAPEKGGAAVALALSVEDGAEVRHVNLFQGYEPEPVNALNSYASPTCVIDEDRVYCHFGTYGTACVATDTGKILWSRNDLKLDHSEGPGGSPVVYDDLLILNVDGRDVQYVAALDKLTGKTRWKTERSVDFSPYVPDMRKAFGTPVVMEIAGQPTLVSQGAQAIYGYDPATGAERWRLEHPSGFSTICVPQRWNDLLIVDTGYMKPEVWAARLPTKPGDAPEVVWRHRANCPNMPSPVLLGDLLFMISDNGGVASCLNVADGAVRWTERIGGNFSATPLIAGGRVYFFDRDGKTTVVEAAGKFAKLAENRLGAGCMASPAIVGKSLFLRTTEAIVRIEA